MVHIPKFLCLIAAILLIGCKDVLTKPLATVDRPTTPKSLEGHWVTEAKNEHLDIIKTKQEDWYQFRWQQQDKLTEGRFVVAHFKIKQVLNIDLASVKVNGNAVISDSQSAYLLLAAFLDDEEMELVPADMERFEKYFSRYFYASPIMTGSLCLEKNSECSATFNSGNMLMSKRMKKFNEEFVKNYRWVFPHKKRVAFKRQ